MQQRIVLISWDCNIQGYWGVARHAGDPIYTDLYFYTRDTVTSTIVMQLDIKHVFNNPVVRTTLEARFRMV
jgi:hypothetical protein